MRVALVTDTYLPQLNGVSRTLARLVEHLGATGHEVALVSPRISGPDERAATTLHIRVPGIPLPLYRDLKLTRPMTRWEGRLLTAFNPQVVHCATESVLGWGGRRWALRNRRPLITSFHTNFPAYAAEYRLGAMAPLGWRLLRRFHAPAHRTFCPSSQTLAELQTRGFHPRLSIWSRGVDTHLFSPNRRNQAFREEVAPGAEVLLLYVGRLAGEKRLDVLMDAFISVRDRASVKVGLLMVGDGPLGPRLRERRVPGVHFLGFLTGEALGRAYASGDVFAFPSDTETFGNVALEAMASGLPVVSVRKGGVQDVVDDGRTGVLVEPRDPEALADALLTLVEAPARRRRMAEAARAEALDRGWSRILDRVVEGYHGAVEGVAA